MTSLFHVLRAACALCVFASLAPGVAWCNGFRNPPEGPFLGQIGGKIAHVDDVSAISLNPANLTDLTGLSVLGTTTLIYADTTLRSASGQELTTKQPLKVLPSFFAALPISDSHYVLGLGITSPFGQSTVWGKESILRYSIPWYSGLTVVNINPTFAVKLSDELSVGVGADIFLSRLDMRQFFAWSALTGDSTDSDGEARFLADGFGMGGNLGITWKFADRQKLALTYRSSVDVEYDGTFHITNIPPSAKLPPPFRGATSASGYHTGIEFPTIIALGYGIEPTDQLRVGADVEWVQFSTYHRLRSDIENNDVLQPSTGILQDWRDIWTFGVGADWKFEKEWVLRSGYQFLESPIPDQTLSPTLPDADKHVFSVGIGYNHKRHSVSISYAHTLFEKREINNNQNPAFNGSYDLSSDLLAFSYSYSF